jgi:hypothetical protein
MGTEGCQGRVVVVVEVPRCLRVTGGESRKEKKNENEKKPKEKDMDTTKYKRRDHIF